MPTFADSFMIAQAQALGFLEIDYSFRRVECEVNETPSQWIHGIVKYESRNGNLHGIDRGWSVVLDVAPLRLELDLFISNGSDERYKIEEVHQLEGAGDFPPRRHDLFMAMKDPDALRAEFDRLAAILKKDGRRFFAGDESLWADLAARRSLEEQASDDAQAIAESERAFRAHHWHQVVDLLLPRAERLDALGRARLAYAAKKCVP